MICKYAAYNMIICTYKCMCIVSVQLGLIVVGKTKKLRVFDIYEAVPDGAP